MIRLFEILYKKDLNELPDAFFLFMIADKAFHLYGTHCPNCRTKGRLSFYPSYERNLVGYGNGSVQENRVTIRRVYCSSCETTSAILPDIIVPYKTYSLLFILHVLKAYFFRKGSVPALCAHFGIAAATLYAWKMRYLTHKVLHLGVLEKYFHTEDPHLSEPASIFFSGFLSTFSHRFGFSFLQYKKATRFNSS